ncbi:D-threo-aldose 1-dehydrogenase [Saccharopolyspora erythraea NRRL 2338]|uniref:Oxidoreductase n=2 Tax=Saccharopolyspora erythraea TaxID=1836 RepID=A4FGN0_SACEN|nr:aldo/keto reductase [Saccharopolyspora erythraea]EQD82243.1 aldo/keto reductase [Saccharopolyspora erythraea D]PFG96908.1 D-threo-aldose 1-dehydrogenase [Saccharopolyspora erythraea NRRL 2338]QRK87138.1 aldo/keto reductase [Saccharopolyspora erythraea]CAM03205.1 oxidoreductase [Saccharopolyspora erythraea NRRL 2338]
MKRVRLGRSRVRVSGLGFGGAVIGNLYREVAEDTALAAVDAAWEAGVRYFDTAPHYGLGLAERRLGRALADRPRDSYALSTKVGRLLVPRPDAAGQRDHAAGFDVPADHVRQWDFSADGVRRSLEESLRRLGVDRVDVVLLHDPDDHWEQAVGEAYPVLHEWRDQGVVGAIGAGMNQWPMLERFVTETDIDAVMLAGRYTLLEQSASDTMLPECLRRGVSVLAAGVFNGGLLATDAQAPDAMYDYRPASRELRAKAERMREVCRAHGVSLPQAAIAFAAGHPAVAGVVLGMRSADEVVRNAELHARPVPRQLWADLVAAGLLRPDVTARDS